MEELDSKEFDNAIAQGKVLVDFWAPWCGPCRLLHPQLEMLQEEMGDKLQIVKVNVDEEDVLANRFRVMSIPTLILFEDGEIKKSVTGARSAQQLKEVFEL